MLGFHSNFYHSWRGDTPDETDFGTDIRLARFILDEIDRADEEGLDARGYWDHDNLFTLETIMPAHAPDIARRLRRRVEVGLVEGVELVGVGGGAPISLLARTFWYGLVHLFTTL